MPAPPFNPYEPDYYQLLTGEGTMGSGTPASGTAPADNTGTVSSSGTAPPAAAVLSGCYQNPAESALAGTVQKESDLPTGATTGQIYKVAGSEVSGFSSYYVRRNGSIWEETFAPGLKNAIDPLTMPHALIRNADDTFTFKPFCWKPRSVGDATSNPAPPFVGRTIRDVFFYQNRLGFLSDENVVMSVAGDFGNFWRRTVLDYLDADTISVAVTTTDVAKLEYAVPFNDGIMLFSGRRQFSLSNGEAGTSVNSIELNPVTNFPLTLDARPVPLGDTVLFATDESGSTSIREYTRLDGRDATDAADITAHVPGLLPMGVTQLIPMTSLDALGVVATNSPVPDRMFVYQFYWDGDRKVISAWRPWAFGSANVLAGAFEDGQLSLVMRRQNKAYLEKIDLRPTSVSANQDRLLYLDRQVTLTGTYDSGTGLTTFTFPYEPDPAKLRVLRSKGSVAAESIIPGSRIKVTGTSVTIQGDESAHPVTAGELYRTAFRLSRQFPQDYQGRNLESGRLQLRSMSLTTEQTPFYQVIIQPYGPDANIDETSKTRTYDIAAQHIGTTSTVLGKQPYGSGATTFLVGADASKVTITLANDTPFASNFVSADWEGLYFNRAR